MGRTFSWNDLVRGTLTEDELKVDEKTPIEGKCILTERKQRSTKEKNTRLGRKEGTGTWRDTGVTEAKT